MTQRDKRKRRLLEGSGFFAFPSDIGQKEEEEVKDLCLLPDIEKR